MPIRPEKMALYPGGSIRSPEWRAMVAAVRERSGNICEKCYVPNGALIIRSHDGQLFYHEVELGSGIGTVFCAETGKLISERTVWCDFDAGDNKVVKIVLTAAHLFEDDESTTNIDRLRYWCQRCHNRYDAKMRARGIAERRRAENAVADLFEGVQVRVGAA